MQKHCHVPVNLSQFRHFFSISIHLNHIQTTSDLPTWSFAYTYMIIVPIFYGLFDPWYHKFKTELSYLDIKHTLGYTYLLYTHIGPIQHVLLVNK